MIPTTLHVLNLNVKLLKKIVLRLERTGGTDCRIFTSWMIWMTFVFQRVKDYENEKCKQLLLFAACSLDAQSCFGLLAQPF